jgi:hypothetical protein
MRAEAAAHNPAVFKKSLLATRLLKDHLSQFIAAECPARFSQGDGK